MAIYCKETTDISHGGKQYGVALELQESRPRQIAILDEDELAPLADALDYLSKVNSNVTALPAFNADYTTKCGLRFAAHTPASKAASSIIFRLAMDRGFRDQCPGLANCRSDWPGAEDHQLAQAAEMI